LLSGVTPGISPQEQDVMSDAETLDQSEQRDADEHDHTDTPSTTRAGTDRDETLSRLSRERKEARERARQAEERLATLEQQQREAAEAKAKEDGKWQELAEKREADLTDATTKLESAATELEELRTYVTADIAAAVKDLPKTLVAFDPGEDAPIGQRLAWLTKAKAAAAEMEKSSPRGNGPNPKPGGNVQINERQEIDRVRSSISL
jgi:hypothetical protein